MATKRWHDFHGQLSCLSDYLGRKIIPLEAEEIKVRSILINIQNIFEHELEIAISSYINKHDNRSDKAFLGKMREDYVNFKTKYEWARKRGIISERDKIILNNIRILRNSLVHIKPSPKRAKYKFMGQSLLTLDALKSLFSLSEAIRNGLAKINGASKGKWPLIPPGFDKEMNW